MSNPIILPPLPEDDIEHDGYGKLYKYGHSDAQLRARDLEVARVVLEAAAKVCEQLWPEMHKCWGPGQAKAACEDCAAAISALEVRHHD